MKKIIFALLVCTVFAATSCESMLDIPQKGVVSYDDFYASDEDAAAALNGMYANYLLNVAATEGIDNPEQVILNYAADDILAAGGDPKDHAAFRVFCEFSYDNQNATLSQAYQRYYYSIYHANLVISNFTNENRAGAAPKHSSAFVDQCVAEARVMRAYLHMMLALSWNTPPVMTRLYDADELPTNAAEEFDTQEEILGWVISECETALNSGARPVRKDVNDKDATARMSRGFAQFVAGKAAMFKGDWQKAYDHLGALKSEGKYALVPSEDYWINFHVAGDGSVEKIFEPNFIEDPAFTNNAWGSGAPIQRGRWMVANVFCWRTDHLATQPLVHDGFQGWNGGAIQEDFAKKFYEHDGDSPRRRACFLTADEWLYEMDWLDGKNDGSLDEKKKDPNRGISSADGVFSHGPYFEWKHMVYINPPKILTGDKQYPSDNVTGLGPASNQKNFNVARYAEALLLYAEACYRLGKNTEGLAALNEIQVRSGSGKISGDLTFESIMEEKQYEMWFESCRFHDLVRWSKQEPGIVNLNKIYNESGIHNVPVVKDAFFTKGEPEHRLYTAEEDYVNIPSTFVVGKHEYLPFPHDFLVVNPQLNNVLGWSGVR